MRPLIRPDTAVVVLTALAILAIGVASTLLLIDLRHKALQHARLETVNLDRMLVDQTEQTFEEADLVLKGVQERMESGLGSRLRLDSLPVHLLLGARISGLHQFRALFIVNSRGEVENSSHTFPIEGITVVDREYFKFFALNGGQGLFIGKPVRSLHDKRWTLHLARPLRGADGKLRGIVVGAMNLSHFEQIYDFMKLDFVRPISLYLNDGTLIASLPHKENAIGSQAPELPGELPPMSADEPAIVPMRTGDGMRQTMALGTVDKFPLMVSVLSDDEEALASWRETAVPIALGGVAVCLFIGIAAAVLVGKLNREAHLSRALSEAVDRHHRTIDSMMDAIIAIDEAHHIVIFNPAAESMFRLSAADAIGTPLERLIPERQRQRHRRELTRYMLSDAPSRRMAPQIEILGLRGDGTEFPIESSISRTTVDGRLQLTAVLRDVTQRRESEASLRTLNQQLRELSSSLQSVREQERRRISRELHDDLGQQLTGLKLELSWLSGRIKEARPVPFDRLDGMRHQIESAIAGVRRISTELRPIMLEDLGFEEALTWHARTFSERTGLAIALDIPAAGLVDDDTLAMALFRIAQEALTNVVRHANATRAELRLITDRGQLVMLVSDNGAGLPASRPPGGIGLLSMRERVIALGGQFNVSSRPGAGTTIEVSIPLHATEFTESTA